MDPGGYESSDDDSDKEERKRKRNDLAVREKNKNTAVRANRSEYVEAYSREEGLKQRYHQSGLDAYTRHKQLINTYILYCGGSTSIIQRDRRRDRTDSDVIREHHQFLWDESKAPTTWEQQFAKKYYDKLFKEYCIADLSRYMENKVALRWRIEAEVVSGKGHFICGNKVCSASDGLRTWEVNFAYVEHDEKKNALVKLRLCPDCSFKLNYHFQKKEIKRNRKHRMDTGEISLSKRIKVDQASTSTAGEGDAERDEASAEKPTTPVADSKTEDIWSQMNTQADEQSRESLFEEYLQDLLF